MAKQAAGDTIRGDLPVRLRASSGSHIGMATAPTDGELEHRPTIISAFLVLVWTDSDEEMRGA